MVWFDVDPTFDATPFAGIGPLGGLTVDALTLALSGALCGLAARRGFGTALMLVCVLGATAAGVVLLWHGGHDFESFWRGAGWIAGPAAAIALAASLAAPSPGARGNRAIVLAMLLAVVAALALRGAWQVTVEHARTLEYFNERGDEFLSARGWLPDAPEARAYVRRLEQREATGWFGLSNVFGGVVATAAVALAGLGWRGTNGTGSRARGLAIALACAGAVLLGVNGGKGALAALVGGVALLTTAPIWASRRVLTACIRVGVIALPALVALVVALRFGAGADGWGAERSLLMRGFYGDAVVPLLNEAPLGVGAAGFQQTFLQLAAETCPEDAASVHHAWGDWLVAAGVAGVGLIVVNGLLSWWATTPAAGGRSESCAGDEGVAEGAFIGSLFAGALALIGVSSAIDPETLVLLVVSVALMSIAARLLAPWIARCEDSDSATSFVWRPATVATLLVVASLDMLHWHTGSGLWCWSLLAACAAPGLAQASALRRVRWLPGTVGSAGCGAAAIVVAIALPKVFAQEADLAGATAMIAESATPAHQGSAKADVSATRLRAFTYLLEASAELPSRRRVRELAIEQGLLGEAGTNDRSVADDALFRVHQKATDGVPDPRRSVREARLYAETSARMVARAGGDPLGLAKAWRAVTELSPRDTSAWIRLGDALERGGDHAGAREAWAEALRRDGLQALDPARQLTVRQRERVEAKLFSGVLAP